MPKKKTTKSTKKGKSTTRQKKSTSAPKKWTVKAVRTDLKRRDILIPDELEENIIAEIQKMKYLTANEIAKKYNLRVSTAKEFLKLMYEKKMIKLYLSSRRLKIYTAS
ncbi:MAG: hypothetical protein ACTSWR_09115 [Candidatus Helarchaeota archaeon]